MERYSKREKVGEGTFGVVYRAIVKSKKDETSNLAVGSQIALKKIRMGNYKDGISFTAVREIKILQDLRHENVIGVSLILF